MAQEIEIKAHLEDVDALRKRVGELGGQRTRERHFEDNYLLDADALAIMNAGQALRVRLLDGAALLTWKGPKTVEAGVRSREELETRCDDGGVMLQILERLGFERRFRYQKYRETWQLDDVEIMIDETPIGNFVEIEGADQGVRAAADALGVQPESFLAETYPILFRKALAERGAPLDAMVFEDTEDVG